MKRVVAGAALGVAIALASGNATGERRAEACNRGAPRAAVADLPREHLHSKQVVVPFITNRQKWRLK